MVVDPNGYTNGYTHRHRGNPPRRLMLILFDHGTPKGLARALPGLSRVSSQPAHVNRLVAAQKHQAVDTFIAVRAENGDHSVKGEDGHVRQLKIALVVRTINLLLPIDRNSDGSRCEATTISVPKRRIDRYGGLDRMRPDRLASVELTLGFAGNEDESLAIERAEIGQHGRLPPGIVNEAARQAYLAELRDESVLDDRQTDICCRPCREQRDDRDCRREDSLLEHHVVTRPGEARPSMPTT
jgi:hypothetical protein